MSLHSDLDTVYKISLGDNGFETEENLIQRKLKFWTINGDSTVSGV